MLKVKEWKTTKRPAVIGHTRPDIAEVVRLLLKRSPEWNRRLAKEIRAEFTPSGDDE